MKRIVQSVACLCFAAAVAGCGRSSGPHVATGSAQTSTSPTPSAARSGSDHFQASVSYVNCMRQHGVVLPDPRPNGDIELTPSDERLAGVTRSQHDAADSRCSHFLNGFVNTAPVSDQALARVADVALEFARCMRAKGFEYGDPQVTRGKLGRIKILFSDAPYPHDPPGTHPKLDAAAAVCDRGFNRRVDEALNP